MVRKKDEPYCLVLSGGGAKGVFHIGAWKALKELDIEVNAFIGNSIGAIIAGFLAQGNEEKLYFIGDNIAIDYLIRIPDELIENGELKVNFKHLTSFRTFYKEALAGGGFDTSPLKKILHESLDERIIRNSGNDLGVVTFNISDMRPSEVFLEQMEEGTFIDYLMASSAFPGFHHPVIKGKKYIDGGVYDNIPYRLARSRGYRKIITIDISGMGVNKRPVIEGTETIYIKNSINIGGVLDFNKEFLSRFMELGYLDTMKTFGKLKGLDYFIVPDRRWEKDFESLLEDPQTLVLLEPHLKEQEDSDSEVALKLRSILPHSMRNNRRDLLYNLLECGAEIFRLEKIRKYTVEEMVKLLQKSQKEEDEKLNYLDSVKSRSEIRLLLKRIKMVLKENSVRDSLNETPYHNRCAYEKILEGKRGKLLKKGLYNIFPELNGGLFLLDLINNNLIFKL
ncbi:MAG: patatin-like phospholipase family protein [Spirochaetaceae bacterium]|nr:patatin-like phospholipase family protein [Spirochaetaceae bacterium]